MSLEGKIVILGAGVIGLSTAVLLANKGYKTVIVSLSTPDARYIDSDPYYASREAGAHWSSFASATETKLHEIESITFRTFMELSKYNETGVMRVTSVNYSSEELKEENIWFQSLVPEFRFLARSELVADSKSGFSFETVSINVRKYLKWLLLQYQQLGGEVHIRKISHLRELSCENPLMIFNCTGLGSKWLGGVEDRDLYPTRGQTILIEGNHRMSLSRMSSGDDKCAYIIPRDDGTILIGGTFEVYNGDLKVNENTAKDIISRCKRISRDFAEQFDSTKILRHGVGLRPTRAGGIRLEAEIFDKDVSNQVQVLVIHNYGHGSHGYQSSWGSANAAITLAEQELQKNSFSRHKL